MTVLAGPTGYGRARYAQALRFLTRCQQVGLVLAFGRVWLRIRRRQDVRRAVTRHLWVVGRAFLRGDTSAYRLAPTLPRRAGSTDLYGSTHRGDEC